ncbi:MAG: hypothetical protein AMXMBFR13_21300 [Phycisphaerae bacterium]
MKRTSGWLVVMCAVGALVPAAWGAVAIGGTETFDASAPDGALWGVGGPDGWQVLWEERGSGGGANTHREIFGSTGQIITAAGAFPWQTGGESHGQLDPGSRSGDPGVLAVQHMSQWNDGSDPLLSSKQMQYITFTSSPGVVYNLSAWVNTVMTKSAANWNANPAANVNHPRAVGTQPDWFADIQIGLKNGTADATDLDTVYTVVPNLIDNMSLANPADAWVQTPVIQAIGDGGPMTILLKVRAPDISAGAFVDLDVRWDDITITPEPASLALLALGAVLIRRRTR